MEVAPYQVRDAIYPERLDGYEEGTDEGDYGPRDPLHGPPYRQVLPSGDPPEHCHVRVSNDKYYHETDGECQCDRPHLESYVWRDGQCDDAECEERYSEYCARPVGEGRGGIDVLVRSEGSIYLLSEDEIEQSGVGGSSCDGRKEHPCEILCEGYVVSGGYHDVGGIAYVEHHAPGIGRKEFGDQVGDRVKPCVSGEIVDERGECQYDDVVRGEDREHGDRQVEGEEEAFGVPFSGAQRQSRCVLEESGDVKEYGHEHHADEQNEYSGGIEPCGSLESVERLSAGDEAEYHQKDWSKDSSYEV